MSQVGQKPFLTLILQGNSILVRYRCFELTCVSKWVVIRQFVLPTGFNRQQRLVSPISHHFGPKCHSADQLKKLNFSGHMGFGHHHSVHRKTQIATVSYCPNQVRRYFFSLAVRLELLFVFCMIVKFGNGCASSSRRRRRAFYFELLLKRVLMML